MAAKRRGGPVVQPPAASDGGGADPRLYVLNDAPVNSRGAYVLYWCRAYRRGVDNLALDHAVARANALGLGVVAYEALDPRHPHSSDRSHAFVLQGVAEAAEAFEARNVRHVFYLPRTRAQARASRALATLARDAALVVTDWYPPAGGPASLWARTASTARALPCRMEAYDDAAIVPVGPLVGPVSGARGLRGRVMAALPGALVRGPEREARVRAPRELALPFEPEAVRAAAIPALLAACEVDHAVGPVGSTPGGISAARARLDRFVARTLRHYHAERNDMARTAYSGISAYLHFGHISPREVARTVSEDRDAPAEARAAFIEQLVVRRALSFVWCASEPGHAAYDTAVPAWARQALAARAGDPRPASQDLGEWESARTPDALWNAAQRELVRDGVIHPYARMLWGKVGITLAPSPQIAFAWLNHLNDKYALDGRDPNGYENVAWCFGLHDRPFPPRPVYGPVRSMTSRSAANKWDVGEYLRRVGAPAEPPASVTSAATRTRGGKPPARDELDQRPLWDDD